MELREQRYYILMLAILGALALSGIAHSGLFESLTGFMYLQISQARLINDFTQLVGLGGTFLNAGIMGLLALFLIWFNKVRLSGPTFAAIFTIVGFSLFGKTPLNALPVILGVMIAARLANKPFKNYLMIALFGTAAGPIISFVVAELALPLPLALPLGLLAGTATGILLPGLAMAMLRMHEGYSLYNIGLTVGTLSLFAAALARAAGNSLSTTLVWNTVPDALLTATPFVLSLVLLVTGLLLDRTSLRENLARLYRSNGRLPSDFMDFGAGNAALVNAGAMGLLGSSYLFLIGADFNGPTLGSLFTMIGFSAFGKHLRSALPVMLGVLLATLLSGKSLTDPGPVLAIIFATTLAPLSGEFGPLVGLLAGMVHLLLVEQTALWNGGMNLYNNGFAGGLTATLFVAVLQWWKSNRSK